MTFIDINLYKPNAFAQANIGEVNDHFFLTILNSNNTLSELITILKLYINTFSNADNVSLLIFFSQSHLQQESVEEIIIEQKFDVDEIPDLILMEDSNSEDVQIPSLLSACKTYIGFLENDSEHFIFKAMALNKQAYILAQNYPNEIEHVSFIGNPNEPQAMKYSLSKLYQNHLKQGMREFIISSNSIQTSAINHSKDQISVIGLGLDESEELCETTEVIENIVSFLSTQLKENEVFAIVGETEAHQNLLSAITQSKLNQNFMGSFFNFHPKHFQYKSLIRDYLNLNHYTDKKLKYIVICSSNRNYLKYFRSINMITADKTNIIFPFFNNQQYSSDNFDVKKPILVMTLVGSGTTRFTPVFNSLMEYFNYQMKSYTEPCDNQRFMESLKTSSVQQNQSTHLINEIFQSHQLPGYRFPSSDELSSYYIDAIKYIDNYQILYLMMRAFSPIKEFKNLKNMNVIVLMRDPRDIIISHYFALLHTGYFYLSEIRKYQKSEIGYPDLFKEDILLELINNGSTLLSPNKLTMFPKLSELSEHYIQAIQSPSIYILRFEDLHIKPLQAYQNLFQWLGLSHHPLRPLNNEMLEKNIYFGTFEFITGGQSKRGQETELDNPSHGLFRKGILGDWKNHFTPKIKAVVKEIAGDALIEMGYETDLDW